jgi:hypothetical protein
VGLTAWRASAPASARTFPDTYDYVRIAHEIDGDPMQTASRKAERYVCAAWRPARPACAKTWVAGGRYTALFTGRVGYPLAIAVLLPLIGNRAVEAATLAFAVAAGVLLYLLARALGLRRATSVVVTALLFLSPAGGWITARLSEGSMLDGLLLALLGSAWLLREPSPGDRPPGRAVIRRRTGAVTAVVAGLGWAWVSKSANGTAATLALLVVAATLAASRAHRRPALLLAGIAAGCEAAFLVAQQVWHLPALTATLRDTLTAHFRRPMPAHPLHQLWSMDHYVGQWILHDGGLVFAYCAAAVAIAVLIVRMRLAALPLVVVAGTGALMPFVHPIRTEATRLLLPLWLVVVVGAGALAQVATGPLLGRVRRSRRAGPAEPAGA